LPIKRTIHAVAGYRTLCSRRNKNIAAVALANKNAWIVWALLSKKTDFLPEGEPALVRRQAFKPKSVARKESFTHDYVAIIADGKQVEPAFAKPYESAVP
jgi:hypothetical protein